MTLIKQNVVEVREKGVILFYETECLLIRREALCSQRKTLVLA